MASRPRLLSLVLLLGCGHSEPFTNPDTGTDRPFDPGPPVRLTANRGGDLEPAWTADGRALLYSVSDPAREDRDVCLGLIPSGSERQSELWCDVPAGPRSTDAILAAGPAPDGRLAYLASTSGLANPIPETIGLRVSPSSDPTAGAEVLRLPYSRSGRLINWTGRIHWIESGRLAYVGRTIRVRENCANFVCAPPETTFADIGVELLTLRSRSASPLPGTTRASGLAVLADGAVVLYTLPGESRIYRRNLASGAVTVAYDFGTAGPARDLDAVGTRIVAVVGGVVREVDDPDLGAIQADRGGLLHLVDLANHSDTPIPEAGRLYRHPALSPSGDVVIAEGYQFQINRVFDETTGQTSIDTVITSSSDLYRFGGP
jgi:WD40 repeat protein